MNEIIILQFHAINVDPARQFQLFMHRDACFSCDTSKNHNSLPLGLLVEFQRSRRRDNLVAASI